MSVLEPDFLEKSASGVPEGRLENLLWAVFIHRCLSERRSPYPYSRAQAGNEYTFLPGSHGQANWKRERPEGEPGANPAGITNFVAG